MAGMPPAEAGESRGMETSVLLHYISKKGVQTIGLQTQVKAWTPAKILFLQLL